MKGKLGSAKRFGTRYGATLKQKLAKIEVQQKAKHQCPECRKPRVKRVSYGIWQCTACGLKFASRAYQPKEARSVIETKNVDFHEAPEEEESPQPEESEEETKQDSEVNNG